MLDLGPARELTPARDLTPAPDATPDVSARLALAADPAVDRVLQQAFGTLYAQPEIAQATYQDMAAFAGSQTAAALLVQGGADGAARLGPLNEAMTPTQRANVPAVLGRALDGFGPSVPGAVSQIEPGATVLRDADGVPIIAQAREFVQASPQGQSPQGQSPQGQTVDIGRTQWVAGVGIEGRGQGGVFSGSAVAGVVVDDDGSFGTYQAIGGGVGVGLGGQVGPSAFLVVGPDDIEDISGFGLQAGAFAAHGVGADLSVTIPLTNSAQVSGVGVGAPVAPSVGEGIGAYAELGYTRVQRMFELGDLQARGGAALEGLSGKSRETVDGLMAGLNIRSYAEMASYLITMQRSISRQVAAATRP